MVTAHDFKTAMVYALEYDNDKSYKNIFNFFKTQLLDEVNINFSGLVEYNDDPRLEKPIFLSSRLLHFNLRSSKTDVGYYQDRLQFDIEKVIEEELGFKQYKTNITYKDFHLTLEVKISLL